MTPSHPLLGGAVAVLGAIAYGINVPAARIAGIGGVSGGNLAFQRSLVLVLVLGFFIGMSGRAFRMRHGEEKRILMMGFLAAITGLGYLSSLNFLPVAMAVAVFYTFPLLLILAAPWTGGGTVTMGRVLAFLIAFTGILLCVGPSFDQLDWRGMALAFSASVACAGLMTITATVKQDRLTLLFWTQAIALPLFLTGAMVSGFSTVSDILQVWPAVIIAALGFYVGYACQLTAGGMLKPVSLGLIFLIEPVTAIAVAALVLKEPMLPLQYLGVTLVIGGLALDAWAQGRARIPLRA